MSSVKVKTLPKLSPLLQEEFQVKDYLIMCVYGLIVLVSLFGNFLVFSVILRTRRLHTITNLFIANLAFGDLLMTTFNIPFTVVIFLYEIFYTFYS